MQETTCLRKLRIDDAARMLEWMRDKSVVEYLRTDFQHMTLQDCQQFIQLSWKSPKNLHLAIVDESDTYMGTVSLKSIDKQNGTAELGICMHPAGMGMGLAKNAMAEIFTYGFQTLGLTAVYWCVSIQNQRANRFYQKNGYTTVDAVPVNIQSRYRDFSAEELVWYCAT